MTPGRGQEFVHHLPGVRQLLEVVQDQQGALDGELGDEGRRAVVVAGQTHAPGDLGPHHVRRRDRLQRDEVDPVRERIPQRLRGGEGQARLPRATGSGQRHQSGPVVGEQRAELADLARPPDGRRRGGREPGQPAEAAHRREVAVQPVGHQLVEVDRLGDVLEPVAAEVEHRHAGQRLPAPDPLGGLGQHDLAAGGDRRDPRRQVDVEPDVAVLVPDRLTRVQAHPHAHPLVGRPGVPRQVPLRLEDGVHRVPDGREDDEEAVPLGPELASVPPLEGAAHQRPLGRERVGVVLAELPQQAGRSLDVAEEQRDGPRGEPRVHGGRLPTTACSGGRIGTRQRSAGQPSAEPATFARRTLTGAARNPARRSSSWIRRACSAR